MQLEKEKEVEQLKEYNRTCDKLEKQREAEMKARMDKQVKIMGTMQAKTDVAKKSGSVDDASRAEAQQEEMDKHFHQAEVVKQNRLRQLRLENQAYLLKQMEQKEARKAGDKEMSDIQAQIMLRDSEEYLEREKHKFAKQRTAKEACSKDIKKQIAFKLSQPQAEMTEAELQLNRPLLNLVKRTLEVQASEQRRRPATIPEGEE